MVVPSLPGIAWGLDTTRHHPSLSRLSLSLCVGVCVCRYAETKAIGELEVRGACSPALMTITVAPHQVYGPRDKLLLPNLLHAAGVGTCGCR